MDADAAKEKAQQWRRFANGATSEHATHTLLQGLEDNDVGQDLSRYLDGDEVDASGTVDSGDDGLGMW